MIIRRQKNYSKPDSEKSMSLGSLENRVKFKDMTEKQLKNIASYKKHMEEKNSTKKGRRENRRNNLTGRIGFTGLGAAAGFSRKVIKESSNPEILKSTGLGALAGLATWELLKIAGNQNHKKNAALARKELERRGIKDWETTSTLEERNKEVLDDLKEKNYSFLGFGKTKESEINKDEFIKEFESYKGHNKQAIDEVKNHLKPGIKFPKSLESYISFIFENYKEGTYRTGKNSVVLGYDEVIDVLKKWEKSFGKSDKVILSQGKSEGFPKQIEYYAWWDRAQSIWMFVVSWGGFAQGLFGLGDSSQDPMTKLKWII